MDSQDHIQVGGRGQEGFIARWTQFSTEKSGEVVPQASVGREEKQNGKQRGDGPFLKFLA